ncbi:MAG: sigma 54-interacting transcriptional regulator [Acidobacteria bacterium]|nr:sigma 54-interacting transcriptional regulator [Acidobacteriota bacterium]
MKADVEYDSLTLERRLKMYEARDAIINRVNPEVNRVIDLEKFLQAATDELGKLMEVERCNLLILSPSGELTIGYEFRSDDSIPSILGLKIPLDLKVFDARNLRRSIAIHDSGALSLDPMIARIVDVTQTRSLLIVPVVLKSELLGYIGLHYCNGLHPWVPEEVSYVESIARQVAIGYEYARLYMEKEKEAKISRALLEIANEITRGGDFLETTGVLIEKALTMLGADCGCFAILDAPGERLLFEGLRGIGSDKFSAESLLMANYPGIVEQFQRGEVLLVDGRDLSEPLRAYTSAVVPGAASGVMLPILIKDKLFGVLHLFWLKRTGGLASYDLELASGIANQVAIALEKNQLHAEVVRLRRELRGTRASQPIIGVSEKIRRCIDMALNVADSDTTVLVQGESGTGKELIANIIHYNSRRADHGFVKINCGALPETLLETELFGHERGAFTDARVKRIGKFEEAHGGSLFLDEASEMSASAQVKLLRVLQDGEFTRVGGNQVIKSDVRVIAATNIDLAKAVEAGKFRRDLFYRLNVYPVQLPPLRDRKEDIRPLVLHFLDHYKRKSGKPITGISEKAMQLLQHYDWPGNVRELENAVERSVILATGQMITANDLPEAIRGADHESAKPTVELEIGATMDQVERTMILETLKMMKGDKTKAARVLGIGRKTLYRKLERYRVDEHSGAHRAGMEFESP